MMAVNLNSYDCSVVISNRSIHSRMIKSVGSLRCLGANDLLSNYV